MPHRIIDQPPGQIAFAHAAAGPIDHLRRQHAANPQLLADRQQQHVEPGRIDIGQFGQIADAHQHLGVGKPAADFEIAQQAGGKPQPDRLQHRIDPQPHSRPAR